MDAKIIKFWNKFIMDNPNYKNFIIPGSFYFCDNKRDADLCAKLVVNGIKQATAPSLWSFKVNNENIPVIGDLNIITNWNKIPKAIIKTTRIENIKYKDITAQFAYIEGEGDRSLSYWKKIHKDYYSREMKGSKEKFTEDLVIVCQYFKTIYTNKKNL